MRTDVLRPALETATIRMDLTTSRWRIFPACAEISSPIRSQIDEMKKQSPHFECFVRTRRRWFTALLIVSFVACTGFMLRRSDSAIEAFLFGIIGSLVLTTLISLASAPIIWFITRKKQEI